MFGRWAGFLSISCLVSACYRSAVLDPGEVQRLDLDGRTRSAEIVERDGDRLSIAHYDGVTVETRATAPRVHWTQRTHAFEAPALAELTPRELRIRDGVRERAFAVSEVEDITIYEYAPDRLAIILGVTGGTALLVGALTFNGAANQEPSHSESYPLPLLLATGLTLLTTGIAAAITIPLTSGLGDRSDALRPPRPPRPRRTRHTRR